MWNNVGNTISLPGSVLSPFLFTLAFSIIWRPYPPPAFPSQLPQVLRLGAVWIIAYADDLAIICASSVRLSRCLTRLSRALKKFWLVISLVKTEVLTFATKPNAGRPPIPVRINSSTLPSVQAFRYLGITVRADGSLGAHQSAVAVKSRVAAREVAKLFRALRIRDLFRLRIYAQSFVDSQFYGLELLTLPIAGEIERARKIFLCETFALPRNTATNLIYALLPLIPPVFLLAKRRLSFYLRAQTHDLDCVKEAFLFDMSRLYPHHSSWTAQTIVILEELGVRVDTRRMNLVETLQRAVSPTADVEELCFRFIRSSEDKTLTFFHIFPNAATARDFCSFISTLAIPLQDLLVLFLSSNLCWRFSPPPCSSRGHKCPICWCTFWSWEHFLQCAATGQRSTLFLEFSAAAYQGDWGGIVAGTRDVLLTWARLHERETICFDERTIDAIFDGTC